MKRYYFLSLFLGYSLSAFANPFSRVDFNVFEKNPYLSESFISSNLYQLDEKTLTKAVRIYRTYPKYNENLALFAEGRATFLQGDFYSAITIYRNILSHNPLLHPVRIELAIALFQQKRYNSSKNEFEMLKNYDLPQYSFLLIDEYLKIIKEKEGWNIDFSVNYIRDKNINNVSSNEDVALSSRAILKKSGGLLPQNGKGFSYYVGLSKTNNIINSHYILFDQQLWGKHYWNNHQYDDISSRTYMGYAYKTAKNTFQIKPFYEKRWYANESYRWSHGINIEESFELNPHWRLSTSFEWAKAYYFDDSSLNGHNWRILSTLVWQPTRKQYFYLGGGKSTEHTQVKQYGSDSKIIRLGWGKMWFAGISTQVRFSAIKREYKDIAVLGNLSLFSFNKKRKDLIYSLNMSIWKQDWSWMGIAPKIQFSWRKQDSNIPQMYSYQDKSINLLFEKIF